MFYNWGKALVCIRPPCPSCLLTFFDLPLIVSPELSYSLQQHPLNRLSSFHYKKDIFVVLYNKMGLQSTKFKLKGCFVRKRPCMYSLSYQGEDVLKVDVELCVDNIEIEKGMLSELISKTEQGLLSSVVTPGKGTLETLL